MKAAALRGALSDRARAGRVHVVDGLVQGEKPSTKAALAALRGIVQARRVLLVLERGDNLTWLSLRNERSVHLIAVDQLNTYDVLLADDLVFTRAAYDAFVAGRPAGKSVKAVAASTEGGSASTEGGSGSTEGWSAVSDAAQGESDADATDGSQETDQ
jgi:large subunit ribosomal protein L4